MSKQKFVGCLGLLGIVFLVLLVFRFFGALMESGSNAPNQPAQPETKPTHAISPAQNPAPAAQSKTEISDTEAASLLAAKMEARLPLTDDEQGTVKKAMMRNYEDAMDAVKKKLKDPADATFSRLFLDEDAVVGPYGYHQWVCGGWVDAFNSFGAKERIKWGACVFRSDTNVRIEYMEIGDSIYGQMPVKIPFPLTPEQLAAQKAALEKQRAAELKKFQAAQAKAVKENQEAADRGDAYSLLRMGERYRDGDGVETNLDKAREYLTKAAAVGSITASNELANLPKKTNQH